MPAGRRRTWYRGAILIQLSQRGMEQAVASILERLFTAVLGGVMITMMIAYLLLNRQVITPPRGRLTKRPE